ncbi:DUF503 domain-containing protein [bacterium]|nr:DUF503 domain-containing protein [bacterium]
MVVGTLEIRILIRQARSLKDKRRVVLSLKDRIRDEFLVSCAEVDRQDSVKEGVLGVAIVGSDHHVLESVLQKVVDFVERDREAELVSSSVEWR